MFLVTVRIILQTKNHTSLFVQKHYFRANYVEANFEEDMDLKNQY